jgi:Tfp pilus assembly protein PilN
VTAVAPRGKSLRPDFGAAPASLPELPAVPVERPRPRPRRERRPRVASGVVLIAIIGVLLVGVVFMNLAVLRLNIRLDQLGRDRARLHADIAEISSNLSSEQAAARIQAQARTELHLVPALASDTTFLDLPAK